MTNTVLEALKNRRSIRRYKAEQITEQELSAVLEAGIYAPTAKNLQSPLMVVVQDKETIAKLSRMNAAVMGNPDADPFYGAPTVVIVLADSGNPNGVADASLVMGNLMNAAYGIGLGSCWINRAREVFETEEGRALLRSWGVDDKYAGVGNCILGYPDCPHPEAKPRKENYVVRV
ncbi:MAG: nitroreductase [Clostridia bacterium]|nr:nitroreductase [Clostridia bacterium]